MTDETLQPRVLVAEDDPATLLLIGEALELNGFVVDQAEDGSQALELVHTGRPDILLTDLVMPKCDGLSVCTALRMNPEFDHLPILVVTAMDDHTSIGRAFAAGATDFITKPINYSLLPRRMRYVLRSSQTIRRLADRDRRLTIAQNIVRLGYWDTELGTDRLRISEEVCDILGLPQHPDPPPFSIFLDQVDAADKEHVRTWLAKLRQGIPQPAIIFQSVAAFGQKRWIRQQAEIVRTGVDQRPVLYGVLQDVTALHPNEERFRHRP